MIHWNVMDAHDGHTLTLNTELRPKCFSYNMPFPPFELRSLNSLFLFQELEIVIGDEHISFTTSKIGSLVDVNQSK